MERQVKKNKMHKVFQQNKIRLFNRKLKNNNRSALSHQFYLSGSRKKQNSNKGTIEEDTPSPRGLQDPATIYKQAADLSLMMLPSLAMKCLQANNQFQGDLRT